MQVPVPCSHGGYVHVCLMFEEEEHLARWRVDPRSCVACRSERAGGSRPSHRAGGSRPPHPVELARGLSLTEPGGRWEALRSTIQFVDFHQRGAPGRGGIVT